MPRNEFTLPAIQNMNKYTAEWYHSDLNNINENYGYNIENPYELTVQEIDGKVEACKNLNETQKEKLKHLLLKRKEVFEKKPGLLTTYAHELIIRDTTPWFCRPLADRQDALDKFRRMLDLNISRRSNSQYINPVKIIRKRDGSIRPYLAAQK